LSEFSIHHSAFSICVMAATDGHALDIDQALAGLSGHGIVAGFGIPGRAVANQFVARRFPFCVIERNPATVDRCALSGLPIFEGDATDEADLRRAGVERAAVLVLAMPNEQAVLAAVPLAKRLNPGIKILARCRHVSTALEAMRIGADEVVSEEQVIAEAFARTIGDMVPDGSSAEAEASSARQG
jgi:voltage-gated potassium channel